MRALLADDERLARAALRRLLQAHSDVMVIGEASNAAEVLSQIHRLHPDVLFLDVEMPGCSGLELLEQLDEPPPVIFTTAHEIYAVRAFDVSAIDYLVKPIVAERLASALNKIRALVDGRITGTRYAQRVFLREGERCWIAAVSKIRLFESEGNYTRVHFGENRALINKSLSVLEAKLDPGMFFRASRSHIVNLQQISSLQPQADGALLATLSNGVQIPVSRRQSRALRDRLSL
jgi:two-component system, LytTR family, response regulator